jgi:hypothetical protein
VAKNANAPSKPDDRNDTKAPCRDEDDRERRDIGSKMSDEGNSLIRAVMGTCDEPCVLTRSRVGLGLLATNPFMPTMSVRSTPTRSLGSAARTVRGSRLGPTTHALCCARSLTFSASGLTYPVRCFCGIPFDLSDLFLKHITQVIDDLPTVTHGRISKEK